MYDDQHGRSKISSAVLLNALKNTEKEQISGMVRFAIVHAQDKSHT